MLLIFLMRISRQYIYDHVDEDVPDLKLKFDIDADVEGDSNSEKQKLYLMVI